MASMNTRRGGAGVEVINDILYAIGGDDLSEDLRSCEMYNPKTNVWSNISSK